MLTSMLVVLLYISAWYNDYEVFFCEHMLESGFMKTVISEIKKLFELDVTTEGESNKLVRVLRSLEFALFLYATICSIFSLVRGNYPVFICYCIGAVFSISLIHFSYHMKVITQILWVNVFTIVAVCLGYFVMGGETRIHNFLFVLTIMVFFAQYGYYKLKAAYCVVIALLYGFLELTRDKIDPTVNVKSFDLYFYGVMDMVVIFVCIGIICYVYSRDSQHLEGKLLEYNTLLKKQASTDPLTGLSNRRSAIELINKLIKEGKEPGFCVCMCDIDFFKKVNDSYGHDIGDNVLRGIAGTMLEGFPHKCLISRWGGEEFLVVFPEMNGDDAKMILDIIRCKIKKMEFRAGDKRFSVTLTYGLAEYGFDGDSEALVKEADNKLYYGKEHGRDQVVY